MKSSNLTTMFFAQRFVRIRRRHSRCRRCTLIAIVGLALNTWTGVAQETITVVATTDIHGHAMHWDYVADREAPWELTRAATAIDSIRRAVGDRVVLVDAGDLLQGNLFGRFFGTVRPVARHPLVDALNAMRYDAFTPGNHDFDFGVAFIDTALAYAQFNVVSANLYSSNRLVHREYTTVQRAGVRIGITGATTYGTAMWNRDQLRGHRVVRPVLPEVRRALERMQQEGVDLKIVLVHSGLGLSPSSPSRAETENVAAQLAYLPVKPDLVIVGHSHVLLRDAVINGVRFVQPEPWARSLAVAEVAMRRSDSGRQVPAAIQATNVVLARTPPDTDLVRRLADAHDAARSWGALPVGMAPDGWRFDFARAMDTPIVDFINHVQLVSTGAQLSATPAFATRGGFGPGVVRIRDVHAVYPFENTLKVVVLSGSSLRQYIERAASAFQTYGVGPSALNPDVPGYNFDMVSGVNYVLDLAMPPGSRVRQLVYQGNIVQPTEQFSLAVNSHRLVSNDFDMLSGLRVIHEGDRRVFDLLVEEIRRVGTLVADSYFQPSWNITPERAALAVRTAFGAPDSTRIERRAFRVIATSDLHGAVESRVTAWSGGKPVGGLAALGGLIDSLSVECGCTTLLVDAGGALGGSLVADRTFGALVVEAMNGMQYDAAAIGEAELFWGVDTLRARILNSSFPWLAANTRLTETNSRPDWARDWVMIERGGRRIGIIGLTGGASATTALPESDRFITTDPGGAVNRAAREARASGADHVIVLAHAEVFCDRDACRGELVDVMESLAVGSVDLVVGGHSSSEAARVINGIPLLLPGSRGVAVGVADIMESPDGSRHAVSAVHTVWPDSVRSDEVTASLVAAASFPAGSVVTNTVLPISAGREESGIGRLVADAYRNAARAHVAIVHNSAISGSLPAGNVTFGDVYGVQPVRHAIHRMLVRGDVIRQVLEHVVRGAAPTAHLSGLEIEYDPRGTPGNRIRRIRRSGDQGFDRGDTYWLAVSDFMAKGGGGYTMLTEFEAEPTGVSDFDALINYLTLLPRPVEAPTNPRIRSRR